MPLQSVIVVNTAPGCDNFIEQQISADTCNNYIVRITPSTNAVGPFDVYVDSTGSTPIYSAQTRTEMLNGVVVQLGPCTTPTPTPTPTQTPTGTIGASPTPTQSSTATPTPTPTTTTTNTPTPTTTTTNTPTPTTTTTNTPTPSQTGTPGATPTATETPTATPTETPTQTPTNTSTPTPSPTTPIFTISIFTQDGNELISQDGNPLIAQQLPTTFLVTTGNLSASGACIDTSYTQTLYSSSNIWVNSVALFTDISMTTPLNGGDLWYSDGCDALQINNLGDVIGTYSCGC